MTPAAVALVDTSEEEIIRVLRWRLLRLVEGGFDPEDATELATRFDVDLHEALDLVARGCPPRTALQILR